MQINFATVMNYLTDKLSLLSIRNRLILVTSLWLSLMVTIAGTIIPLIINFQLVDNAKTELEFTLEELHQQVKQKKRLQADNILISNAKLYEKKQDRYWQIETESKIYRSPSLNKKRLNDKFEDEHHDVILISEKYSIEGLGKVKIKVALDNDGIEENVNILTGALWFILTCLFIGVLVLVAIQVKWSLKPIHEMQQNLIELKTGQASRIEGRYPIELSPLVDSLNDLLFHYQELLKRARNHTGNMAHALKTPLTVLKNHVNQLAEEEKTTLLIPIENIQKYIDYHLSRARLAGSSSILSVKTSPSERIEAMNMAFDKVYAERDILLINELDDKMKVNVETTDLDEMLGNVLENSYKWSKSLIRIYSKPYSENRVQIIIEDDGNGISDEDFQQVLKRGARLDEQVKGSGLGLNIVKDAAESYQGSIHLDHAELGGLKVTLTLPC